jgi:predicted DNA-binding protein
MSEPTEPQRERLKGQPVWVKLEQYARLRALADKDGKPLAAHARRAIELYLRREERKGQTIEVRA